MLVGGLSVVIIICNNFLICVRLFTDWLPDNGTIELLAMLLSFIFTSALAGPAVMITLNSMFADIADEQELLTGDRQEGRKASFFLLDHSRSRPVVHAQPSSVVSGLI
jgi:Na+/melibiose symporter-like transporter